MQLKYAEQFRIAFAERVDISAPKLIAPKQEEDPLRPRIRRKAERPMCSGVNYLQK